MEQKKMYTEAEACRNTLMLTFYGLESYIKKAQTTADYIDLIRRTGMLAESMAKVLEELAKSHETLTKMDAKDIMWLKKQSTSR